MRNTVIAATLALALSAMPMSALAESAENRAIDWQISLVTDAVGISRDTGSGVRALGLLDAGADVSLEKLAGWNGALLRVRGLSSFGGRPNDRARTAQGIDNIEVSEHRVRLYELYLEQALAGERASLRLGLAAAFREPLPGISPEIYGEADFRALAEIIYASSGNVLPDGKAMLVYSRIAPLVRETGCATFANFIEIIRTDLEMQDRAVAALTTNHTFFYRESHHFDHFESKVRPDLIRKLDSGDPVRIWSAGCSSGEETWSLMMALLGTDQLAAKCMAKRDLRVLASDLAPHALRKAEAGTYAAKDFKGVPSDLIQQWVRIEGEKAVIADLPRSVVRFRLLNLMGEWPMSGKFDTIFCRNVMIYFDLPTKERLVARFAEVLQPGGHLYIGHSERVTGSAASALEPVGPTIYRRRA